MTGEAGWRSSAAAMRAALPRTWYPFFARFPRPWPVQLAAWRPLLEGRDCVVCSPTASGKTEAVLAPLVERHIPVGAATRPRILLVSPTRALVNDLLRRLRPPLQRLGLTVHRRTGDHARLDRRRPPQVLITTPESFDSLLVRHTSFLSAVRAAVLDELHILDGTPRGDQLRLLLWRLRAIVAAHEGRLQVVASSATIHDPGGLAERYLEHAEQIVVEGAKELAVRCVSCPGSADLLAAISAVWGAGSDQARKILAFVASRADVESLSSRAHGDGRFGARVYAHHGSLSRAERERVEARFADDPSALCFATMTLELGIDIGDVDLVVLATPPGSVASFLQRIGRGSRRADTCRVLACCRDRGDELRFRHLEQLARRGDLCPAPYVFRPSVLVQQAGSLLLQSPQQWLTPEVLRSRLPPAVASTMTPERAQELLSHLVREKWLAPGRLGRHVAGESLLEAFDRGDMHANMAADLHTVEVVEESTGHTLGRVMAESEHPREMAIAGRTRQVLRREDGRLWVAEAQTETRDARFAPRVRQVMAFELARSLAELAGVSPQTLPVVETAQGLAVLHLQGSLAGELLARHLKKVHGWPVERGSALALLLDSLPPEDAPPEVSASDLEDQIPAISRRLARLAGAGRYHRRLPEAWQLDFLRRVVPCHEIASRWSSARFVGPADEAQEELLADLARVR